MIVCIFKCPTCSYSLVAYVYTQDKTPARMILAFRLWRLGKKLHALKHFKEINIGKK